MNSSSASRVSGTVLHFSSVRRVVSDLARSIDFYVGALGFKLDSSFLLSAHATRAMSSDVGRDKVVTLTLGDESIELFSPVGYVPPVFKNAVRNSVANAAFQHVAIVTGNMSAATRQLAYYAPQSISARGAVRLPEKSGGVTAFKFRDPDGHAVELIFFPVGVGDPKWHHMTGVGPNLGIDHAAIGVLDVERSIAFYTDVLGFHVVSRQINEGAEQAQLDGVESAKVVVVGLSPRNCGTPHVELLGYRIPKPSRRRPLPPLSEDHSDRMTFMVDDVSLIVERIDTVPGRLKQERSFLGPSLLLRDGDGHLLLLRPPDGTNR
jgi:catechol 2,3-dioxygenase-like lactoylglutathione lyase family enzyme